MRVRVNSEYIYYPNMLDRIDGRTKLVSGDIVKVINLPGCPKANVMEHCYVSLNGVFAGLVHSNSLHKMSDRKLVIEAIKCDMAKIGAKHGWNVKYVWDTLDGIGGGQWRKVSQ